MGKLLLGLEGWQRVHQPFAEHCSCSGSLFYWYICTPLHPLSHFLSCLGNVTGSPASLFYVLHVFIYLMYMSDLPTYLSVHHIPCLESEEGIRSSGTGVMCGYEPPYGYWEPNRRPLQRQPVLLSAEPSLRLLNLPFLMNQFPVPSLAFLDLQTL